MRGGATRGPQQLLRATAHLPYGFCRFGTLLCRGLQGAAAWPQLSPTSDRTTSARAAEEAKPGTTLPSVPGGRGAAGRAQAPSQQRRRKQKSPAPPPAHSRTAPGRTRSSPARRQPGTRGPAAAPAACPMALKRIQKVSGGQGRPGRPRGVPRSPGRTAWEGRGHWGGRGADRPRTGEACTRKVQVPGIRGAPIPPCPLPTEPRALGVGAGGVARLSRGVCIPAGPVIAPQWAACVPYHAVRPHGVPGALLLMFAPRAPREDREGVVGLRPLFSERGAGSFSALQLAGAQWEERAGKARLGRRSQQKALALAILVALHAAATSGHIAVLRT